MGRALKTPVSSASFAITLGLPMVGPTIDILSAGAIGEARPHSLCFIKSPKFLDHVSQGSVVVVTIDLADAVVERGACAIVSEQPRLDFARALSVLDAVSGFEWSTSEPTIHPTAKIGANVVLGRGVRIGANSRVFNNVVIGAEVVIGERCVIKSCAVVGEEGFGFERASDGRAVRLPHIGGVVIEDDVEVGSLTTVCRGTLGDTVLRTGCKVDDHVHIAHNVVVGKHAFVIACAEISGGVTIGEGAWIAPCASVKNQVTIGDRAVIGLGAVVLKNVEADQVIVGNPGKPLRV